jgi:hypothetical protein
VKERREATEKQTNGKGKKYEETTGKLNGSRK